MPIFTISGLVSLILSTWVSYLDKICILKPSLYSHSGRKSTMLRLDFKRFRFNHVNGPTLLVDRESKWIAQ